MEYINKYAKQNALHETNMQIRINMNELPLNMQYDSCMNKDTLLTSYPQITLKLKIFNVPIEGNKRIAENIPSCRQGHPPRVVNLVVDTVHELQKLATGPQYP